MLTMWSGGTLRRGMLAPARGALPPALRVLVRAFCGNSCTTLSALLIFLVVSFDDPKLLILKKHNLASFSFVGLFWGTIDIRNIGFVQGHRGFLSCGLDSWVSVCDL